jgi:NAD(P)-dependent dehydrogenase (short-subunit alcohol dehydrogenase family)
MTTPITGANKGLGREVARRLTESEVLVSAEGTSNPAGNRKEHRS